MISIFRSSIKEISCTDRGSAFSTWTFTFSSTCFFISTRKVSLQATYQRKFVLWHFAVVFLWNIHYFRNDSLSCFISLSLSLSKSFCPPPPFQFSLSLSLSLSTLFPFLFLHLAVRLSSLTAPSCTIHHWRRAFQLETFGGKYSNFSVCCTRQMGTDFFTQCTILCLLIMFCLFVSFLKTAGFQLYPHRSSNWPALQDCG